MINLKRSIFISFMFLFLNPALSSPGKDENERQNSRSQQKLEEKAREIANSVFLPKVRSDEHAKAPNTLQSTSSSNTLPQLNALLGTNSDESQESKTSSQSVFDHIPREIINLIVPYLSFTDQLSFFQTNKRHHSLLKMLNSFEVKGTNPPSSIINFLIKNLPNVKHLFFNLNLEANTTQLNNPRDFLIKCNENLSKGKFTQLQTLSLEVNEIDRYKSPDLIHLVNRINANNLPQLVALKIKTNSYHVVLLKAINDIWKTENHIPQLTSLDLSHLGFDCNEHVSFMSHFFDSIWSNRLTTLKYLYLGGCLATKKIDFNLLCKTISAGKLNNLSELSMTKLFHQQREIENFGNAIATGNLSALKSLNISNLVQHGIGIVSILQAIPRGMLSSLTCLNLNHNSIRMISYDPTVPKKTNMKEFISLFESNSLPHLTTLCLDDNNLLPEDIDELNDAMKSNDFPKLSSLSLSRTQKGVSQSLARLIQSPALVNLTSLTLRESLFETSILKRAPADNINNVFFEALKEISSSKIKQLDLSANMLSDEDLSGFFSAIKSGRFISLSELDLHKNQIRGQAIKEFYEVVSPQTLPSMTCLNLSRNSLNHNAFSYIGSLFLDNKVACLGHLFLSDSNPSDVDMKEFLIKLNTASLPRLKTLSCNFNRAGLDGYKILADMIEKRKLADIERLEILISTSNTPANDFNINVQGVYFILAAIQNVGLTQLKSLKIPGKIFINIFICREPDDYYFKTHEGIVDKVKDLKKSRKIPYNCEVLFF